MDTKKGGRVSGLSNALEISPPSQYSALVLVHVTGHVFALSMY